VTMQQRRLGTTGVWVSELCLGTMMFGEWGIKDHESIRVEIADLSAAAALRDSRIGPGRGCSSPLTNGTASSTTSRPVSTASSAHGDGGVC
jgi:hypothetical protein